MSLPTVEEVQTAILTTLDASGTIDDSRKLTVGTTSLGSPEGQAVVKAALDSLLSKEMVEYTQITNNLWVLTKEGNEIADTGSHEYRVWAALPEAGQPGLSVKDLTAALGADTVKVGQGRAFKSKWIAKDATGGFVKAATEPVDATAGALREIKSTGLTSGGEAELKELQKRKLVQTRKLIHYSIKKGPQFATEVKTLETDLTVEMLASGSWENAEFKQYNFAAKGEPTDGGALHPLLKVREEFRQIFFDMGFTEMPANRFVETAFWNFDAMFVPQQHPARELQDTFYLKSPASAPEPPADYYERVRKTHEVGGYGSIGYRAPFSREESGKLLLRTHTTAVSTAMLYELANQPGGFKPAKLFSIDRVFRNEATDATHLAEFHQVEGVVADYDITLGHLIGFMEEFFGRMGNKTLRFKPAYNPYTEPSMEIFSWHEGLGKWIEIGNSGVFRPEMLEPMGLPKGVRVLGWGFSLERPTMIKYKIQDIRTLVGHKTDLGAVKTRPAVRFEKDD
ncbi:hypothetical protein VHUM_03786 [Vanrija humicola]|uniref:Phenylalanine--tRNA ligase alpha subunit n=1 Tax=Vanrija humicola TaxID=5417 RepID=A0A7D8Z2Y0_VANHU|nr:hypothetical protein VHUM_03786 [Vanrija humicola]